MLQVLLRIPKQYPHSLHIPAEPGATYLDLLADMLRMLPYVNVYSESVVLKASGDVLGTLFKEREHVDGQAAALLAQIAYLPIKDFNQALMKVRTGSNGLCNECHWAAVYTPWRHNGGAKASCYI